MFVGEEELSSPLTIRPTHMHMLNAIKPLSFLSSFFLVSNSVTLIPSEPVAYRQHNKRENVEGVLILVNTYIAMKQEEKWNRHIREEIEW